MSYDKEYKKEYYLNNKEKLRDYNRKWKKENPDKVKGYQIKRRLDGKKSPSDSYEAKKKRRLPYKYNPKNAIWCKNKSARRRGAIGCFTKSEWEILKEKQEFRCNICGLQEPEIKLTADHIIAIFNGGSNFIENIQALCGVCNSKKGTKTTF